MGNRLKDKQAPKQFNVKDIFPDKSVEETAELVADYFTSIAGDLELLTDQEIPAATTRGDFVPFF